MCPGAGLSSEVEEGSQRPTSAIDDGKRIRGTAVACQDAAMTGIMRIGTMDYTVEKYH
jgi:hypothetical protein